MSAPHPIIQAIENRFTRPESLPKFRAGDTVKVWVQIREGEKTRLQAFQGVCIKRSHGGARASFTVRKVSYGVGVERVFAVNSPNVESVEVLARGKVRQGRLYYLRGRSGKAARIKERAFDKGKRKRRRKAKAAAEAETTSSSQPASEAASSAE